MKFLGYSLSFGLPPAGLLAGPSTEACGPRARERSCPVAFVIVRRGSLRTRGAGVFPPAQFHRGFFRLPNLSSGCRCANVATKVLCKALKSIPGGLLHEDEAAIWPPGGYESKRLQSMPKWQKCGCGAHHKNHIRRQQAIVQPRERAEGDCLAFGNIQAVIWWGVKPANIVAHIRFLSIRTHNFIHPDSHTFQRKQPGVCNFHRGREHVIGNNWRAQ